MATKKYVSLSGLSNFLNNLKNLFATKTEMNAKSDKTHTHTIADIANLQSTLNGKAASSHGTHVSYSTTAPVMDGAASVGSASTVARSDHKHPTDTSRASQTDLDSLETVVAGKANSSHTHQYAGSTISGGDANNALKLQGYTRSNLYADLPTWINSVGLSHTVTVEGDKDTYYPVRIYLPSSKIMPTYISIYKNLGSKTPDIEGNHSNGTSSMWLIYEGRNRSWDGNGGYLKTWYRYMGYANLCAHADIGTSVVGDLIVWLRGGGCTYEVSKTSGSAESAVYYEETNIGTESYPYIVSPRKDLGNKGVYSGILGYGNIEGNATTSTKATQDSSGNVITSTYETKTDASNKLSTAKTYADNAATTAATKVKNDLLNGAGGAYDTLKELGDLIDDNKDAIDALEIVASGKANKTHTHAVSDVTNLQTNLSNIQTQLDGKAASSHSHSISNVNGLQSALDGKSSTSHTHTADNLIQWAEALFGTDSGGGVEYSYGSGSGKNVLTEISNMPQGLHTIYAISGTTGNPKTNESFRYLIHKTSGTIGWILAWDAQGSLFTNYQSAAGTFKGWKCVYDANPSALWTGGYYMSSSDGNPQTVKPSKKLSECRNGWVLVWSDYDAGTGTKNNTDIHHDYVFKKNCAGANWSGQCMLCDIPRYMGSNAQDVDTERRILKAVYIHDDRIEGSYQGSYDERNDVVLRAVYEF